MDSLPFLSIVFIRDFVSSSPRQEEPIETDTNVSPLIIAPILPPHLCFAIVSNTGLNTPDLDIFSSVFVTVLEFAILYIVT